MKPIITPPLTREDLRGLPVGAEVLISGSILAARDAAHLKMTRALAEGRPLPFDLQGRLIYYMGPTPAPPGRIIGAAGPTTASRMDSLTPPLLEAGVMALLAKGPREAAVKAALKKHGAVYLAALGGAGALLSRHIKEARILAYPELGPEAVMALKVFELPATIIIDQAGRDWYELGRKTYRKPFPPS